MLSYLERESKLPGAAANTGLLKQFAKEGEPSQVAICLAEWDKAADANSPVTFTVMCGVAASGDVAVFRKAANSGNWRIREAAVLGLQTLGLKNRSALYEIFSEWENANLFEKRCIAATLCEPALIDSPETAEKLLGVLNEYLEFVELTKNVKNEDYKAFKKALGYCVSVVVAALPEKGKEFFEDWIKSPSLEVRWILSENLKHDRLWKMDSEWVEAQIEVLSDVE
ncbi:hypothetical protein AGMMS49938_10980 [Fibrobacterales bacterium]|nr:hypothetical protein AGMMS49938_10980 [Fibrobacterales bacterium]